MRPIKFRGRKRKDGKIIFGSYVHVTPMSSFPSIIDDCGFYDEVEPESVVQFVGYDADGNEIYERDMLKDNYGEVFTAEMAVSLENEHNYTEACDVGDTIFGYRRWSFNEEN